MASIAYGQKITLGQLLTPAYRFPDLNEVFLSCCETNVGTAKPTDDILTLNTGFLSAGARGVISTLSKVEDLPACVFSIIYHQLRQAGQNRPQALQTAQQQLRQLTGKEFKKQYRQELEKVLNEKIEEADQKLRETKKQRDSYPQDSTKYQQWNTEYKKWAKIYGGIGRTKFKDLPTMYKEERPFGHPQYWSPLICAGLKD